MTTFVFPGQGSQKIGMGQDLFDHFPDLTQEANAILGYDIKTLCTLDPDNQLSQTQYTQPALYVVSALSYLKRLEETNITPDYVAGHSLGEYNALFAANVFDFSTGLKLVQERGRLMSEATSGGMAAILGLNEAQVNSVLSSNVLCKNINIANYNSYAQFVISGPQHDIQQSLSLFEEAGASMVIALNVSGAFHSPLMADAKAAFKLFLQSFQFSAPTIPVIANTTAKPYENAECVMDTLANQMTHSVQWIASINYLLEQGETEFVELGTGSVLTGLIRRIRSGK